jgi:hypothetical protein
MLGVNLVNRTNADAAILSKWYNGPTLVDLLGGPFCTEPALKVLNHIQMN